MKPFSHFPTRSLSLLFLGLTLIYLTLFTGNMHPTAYSNPAEVETDIGKLIFQHPGSANTQGSIAKNEHYLLATFGRHIAIFEAPSSDYSNPIKTLSLNSDIYELAVIDDSAYILTSLGLEIWDIADGNTPIQIGTANVPQHEGQFTNLHATSMEVIGDTIYFLEEIHFKGDDSNTLFTVDISDPTKPKQVNKQVVKSRSMMGYQDQFLILKSYLYVIPQMQVYSTEDPVNLELLGSFSPNENNSDVIIAYAALTSDYLYALSWDIGGFCTGMCQRPRTLHILNPQSLEVVSSQYFDHGLPINSPLRTNGNKLLSYSDWTAWNMSDDADVWSLESPLSPERIGAINFTGNVIDSIGDSNSLISLMTSNELIQHNIADLPDVESNVIYQSLDFIFTGVSTSLNMMVGIGEDNKLRILDISSPQEPAQLFKETLAKNYVGLAVKDNLAFSIWFDELDEAYFFEILDIVNPQNPISLGTLELTNLSYFDSHTVTKLQIIGDQTHLLFGTSSTFQKSSSGQQQYAYTIVDISDIQALQEMDVFTAAEPISDFSIHMDTVFLRDGNGVFRLDISDPTQFSDLGYFLEGESKKYVSGPVSHNGYLYVGETSYSDDLIAGRVREEKLLVFDLAASSIPANAGELLLNYTPTDLWIFEGELHLSSAKQNILNIYSLENPTAPTHTALVGSSPNFIYRNEDLLMAQNQNDGFQFYQLTPITSHQFLPIVK